MCLWVSSVAEVDGRHAARARRRKPAAVSGLARYPRANACRTRSQGGKTEASVAATRLPLQARSGAAWTRRWKALRIRRAATLACRHPVGPRYRTTEPATAGAAAWRDRERQ